jgi:two-component sensor histidine kinase
VIVRWNLAQATDGETLRLEWVERDGPAVLGPIRRGYGSRVLDRVLGTQLGAQVTTQYQVDGVRVTIDVPLKGGRPSVAS